MPTKFVFSLLLAGLLFRNFEASAQEVTDSLQFRQAKLGIWCQTIAFVYEDYGADSLKEGLNCASWEALQQSIKPNELQVNSFFQAIEKPAIYAGYTTYEAKLQKLRDEIIRKLELSPARMADPARLEKVDELRNSLLAATGTATATAIRPAPDATVQEEIYTTDSQEIINNDTDNSTPLAQVSENPQESNTTTLPTDEENTMDWTEIAQWALMLILTAGLILLWSKNRKLESNLDQRMRRRKQEIMAISKLNENLKPSPAREKPVPVGPPPLTKAEVQHLIHAEIDKLRQQKITRQQSEKVRPAAKRQEPQERAQPPLKSSSAQKAPSQVIKNEVKEEQKPDAGIYYDKLPFKGGFHMNQLSPNRHPDSIYSIQVLSGKPDEAEFWVTEDQEVQKYAMQNGLSFFEEACDYNQVEENPSRVRNLEKGKLRKNGHLWQIEKKVKVTFE